jgi:hypothetical protein
MRRGFVTMAIVCGLVAGFVPSSSARATGTRTACASAPSRSAGQQARLADAPAVKHPKTSTASGAVSRPGGVPAGEEIVTATSDTWASTCPTDGSALDREAFGTLTNYTTMTATKDTVRDDAVNNIGYPGKHGGRDDIVWHGWRFSIQEAQNSDASLLSMATWRFVLYDYTNEQPYPASITSAIVAPCHGNPKITALDDPSGTPLILLTAYVFGGSSGCTQSDPQDGGPLLYTVAAQ